VLSFAPLVYVGTISYGIYLYHFVLIWAFQREFGWVREQHPNEIVYFVVLSLATIAVATVSWFGFERPLNGLKRYFPYGERQADGRLAADLTPQPESS
jgi:peptidoglycan/LPS O-acetylase OafA/YrhL